MLSHSELTDSYNKYLLPEIAWLLFELGHEYEGCLCCFHNIQSELLKSFAIVDSADFPILHRLTRSHPWFMRIISFGVDQTPTFYLVFDNITFNMSK